MKVEQYKNATLYCGDCREVFDDLPTVQAVITDPPYGIRYETRRRKFMERPGVIKNDISAPLWYIPLIAGKMEDDGAVYICTQSSIFARGVLVILIMTAWGRKTRESRPD